MKISIVIPFYNTPLNLFTKCIQAVKKLKPYEIILVDDCSTDNRIIDIAKNSGCIYLKTPYQSGYDGLPFNLGVRFAKGSHICRVDSDDILLELPTHISYDIHFGNANRVFMPSILTVENLIQAPRAILNATIIKRDLLLDYPLEQDRNVFSDVLLILQLLHNKHTYDIHPSINYIYTRRKNSIQTSETDFHHKLRLIQTVARFCTLEKIDPIQSKYYLNLAMNTL